MTLFKQLFVGTSVAFLVVLGAMEAIYIKNAHLYLREQSGSHAQDAATSLGIVLPLSLADNDLVRAEVTVDAVFDRGYFQSIRVVNTRGETLLLKTLPAAPAGVPQWFVTVLPMETPAAESLVSKGWLQLGRVVVISHPNFAYKQLWQTLLETTLGLALLYLISLVALHNFLSRILRPLREIEEAARAISRQDFQMVKTLPGARELRSVVGAINSMSSRLQAIIEHEMRQAAHFRDESRKDGLTGLDNRRGFEQQVLAFLQDSADLSSGAMYLLKIADFQTYNDSNGFREGDALLKKVAGALSTIWPGRNLLCARISGATFAVAVFNVTREDAARLGDELCAGMSGAAGSDSGEPGIVFGCGGTYFTGKNVTLGALLAQCDMAMLQSRANTGAASVLMDLPQESDDEIKGSLFWKSLILDALQTERLALFAQPVINTNSHKQMQVEVYGRLKNSGGEPVLAGQFIPMADRHQLTPAIDLAVLRKLAGQMAGGLIAGAEAAMNISIHSIHDGALLDWLAEAARTNPELTRKLVFEFTEFGVVQDRAGVERFVAEIRGLGAGFAVDNFGLHRSAFEYLQRLKPRYVKLSPSYIRELGGNHKNQFFISSVTNIAHSLEIQVIALGVEDASLLPLLQELGVDGYQGYLTGGMLELE